MVVIRDLNSHVSHWCSASDVKMFEWFGESALLEQFKNSIPSNIAVYIYKCKVKLFSEDPVLADGTFCLIKLGVLTLGVLKVTLGQYFCICVKSWVR